MTTKVCLFFDKANDWLFDHFDDETFAALRDRFSFTRTHDLSDVKGFDLVFLLGCTRVVDTSVLQRNGLCLVVHESDLPKGRGFAPVQWQVLQGKKDIPVRLLEAIEDVDAGDIYARGTIRLEGWELFDDIRKAQAEETVGIILRFLESYPDVKPEPQTGEPTFFRRRENTDNELDVDATIREQFDLLRLGNNEAWPSHFTLNGHRYLVKIYHDDADTGKCNG